MRIIFRSPAKPVTNTTQEWPLYTADYPQYMSIKGTNWTVEHGPKESICNKWRILLENS